MSINLRLAQSRFGKKEFGFVPQTYVLPWDRKLLKTAWEEGNSKQKYILKPVSQRGVRTREKSSRALGFVTSAVPVFAAGVCPWHRDPRHTQVEPGSDQAVRTRAKVSRY